MMLFSDCSGGEATGEEDQPPGYQYAESIVKERHLLPVLIGSGASGRQTRM